MSRVDKEYAEKTTRQDDVPVIQRLDETLVNRIAAGEIIHRPASALKELIENALDAGATSIKITAKDGGMKLLQIQDNGCGIRKSDLPILCERFTTSKLREFSDLNEIATYGFRGEALASISFVSHLSVVTKTRDDACAWRALYEDGVLLPPKEGAPAEPIACAGNDGTVITAEDLFYNTPVRKSSLRNFNEEYTKLSEVVTRYAIHQAGVAFVCRKVGSPTPDVTTPAGASRTALIRLLFGSAVADALLETNVSSSGVSGTATGKRKRPKNDPDGMEEEVWSESDDEAVPLDKRKDKTKWKAEAMFTNTSYQGKKSAMLLFINHRLVESRRIQRGIETVYTATLPKGAHPFIYLSLEIDPKHVDVNVHPTKREVHFMNEDIIVEAIADAIQAKLTTQSSQRTFTYQNLTPVGDSSPNNRLSKTREPSKEKGKTPVAEAQNLDDEPQERGSRRSTPSTPVTRQPQKALPQHLVRTSLRDRTLDSMFAASSGASSPTPASRTTQRSSSSTDPNGESSSPARLSSSKPTSVVSPSSQPQINVISAPEEGLDEEEILRDSVANMVMNDKDDDEPPPPILIEIPESKCFLTSMLELRKEVETDKHNRLTEIFNGSKFVGLSPAPPLRELVHLAVSENSEINKAGLDPLKIGDKITRILLGRREMLEEYFCISISSEGLVEGLPMLLPGYTPNIDMLPVFLMNLGPRVDWKSEKGCFATVFREIARFYVPSPPLDTRESESGDQEEQRNQAAQHISWQNRHILFPAIQRYLAAPKRLLERDVVQIANLPDLYRVFERC
ncbi:DNA mismatch repair protein Mlh1 [Ceratobasidium sp. AG-Ba]|nr:DNA mismatch repair protein Mlh1 [Ceratobasidium sp. AG-Ba]QRW10907.1 DNA mismatch repair protein Mlh1 [Ceratobasidium sp. AG-Ba]